MTRLKPTTRKAVEDVSAQLHTIADDIEPARPFLASLYRVLAEELESSLCIPDAPFQIRIPEACEASLNEATGWLEIYPPGFNRATYSQRLREAVS